MNRAQFPYDYIPDKDVGRPLFNAELYFGVPDLDPEIPANQIDVYGKQEDGSQVLLPQPIETGAGGVPLYNGSPIELLVDELTYSFKALSRTGAQVYYAENVAAVLTADAIPSLLEDVVLSVGTVADLASISAPLVGQKYIVYEYLSGTGVGGGEVIVKSGAIVPDNGLTFASATPGFYFERINYIDLTDDHFDTFINAVAICAANSIPLVIKNSHSIASPGLSVPTNSVITFSNGVVISAAAGYGLTDVLLDFNGKSDIFWICTGATFQMPKSEYATGEHRHAFNLRSCTNVTLVDPYSDGSGGDGFYINAAVNCNLYRPIADNSRRDGFSIIGATNLLLEAPIAKNIIGTSPECGINIEPNGTSDKLVNIVINNPRVENCNQNNYQIYLDDYAAGSPDDISITINSPVSFSAAWNGYRFSNIYVSGGNYGGHITINNPVSDSDGYAAISIVDKGSTAPMLKISNPVIINPCTANAASPNNAGIYISDSSATVSGALAISDVSIRNDDLGMDYGIFIEAGQGFSDLRITVDNVIGAVIDPVRWNNTSATIASASDAIVDVNYIMKKTAITSATKNVTADLAGTILTNAGAAATVAFFLRDYLPPGNKYRFQIETAQTVQIDVFDSADRIVGTTVAGALISSNVIGEACEAEFLGTFGGVRYWRINILGKQANWTYT
jgi:hypothetical protein